jgi:hypothetical protein
MALESTVWNYLPCALKCVSGGWILLATLNVRSLLGISHWFISHVFSIQMVLGTSSRSYYVGDVSFSRRYFPHDGVISHELLGCQRLTVKITVSRKIDAR